MYIDSLRFSFLIYACDGARRQGVVDITVTVQSLTSSRATFLLITSNFHAWWFDDSQQD
jgi:hypothetical protein